MSKIRKIVALVGMGVAFGFIIWNEGFKDDFLSGVVCIAFAWGFLEILGGLLSKKKEEVK